MTKLIIASLEGKANIFSTVCDPKIGIAEDVDISAVEVYLVKTLVDSPNR